jgi:hypothetical protein
MNMKSLLRLAPVALAMGLASQTFAAAPVPSNSGSYYSSSDCSNLYTQKYDSTFAMTIKGAYGFSSDSNMANIGGGMLSLSSFIETEDLVHELSFTAGLFSSSPKHYDLATKSMSDLYKVGNLFGYTTQEVDRMAGPKGNVDAANLRVRCQTAFPLLAGYNLNIPISANSVHFFLGAKAGVTISTWRDNLNLVYSDASRESKSYSQTKYDFTYSVTAGFRFSVSETADIVLAYELLKIKNIDPYHLIELGVSWTF